MNKTEHYQLNQWDREDRILMEDFNRDNANIDAALASFSGFAKLREVTTTADAVAIEFDVSDIDWNAWNMVLIRFDPKFDSSVFYYQADAGTYQHSGNGYSSNSYGFAEGRGYGPNFVLFQPMKNANNLVTAFAMAGASVSGGYVEATPYSAVSMLRVYTRSTSTTFKPGCKLTLWGVK